MVQPHRSETVWPSAVGRCGPARLAAWGAAVAAGVAACASEPEPQPAREFSGVQLQDVRPSGEGVDVEFWVTDLSPAALARAMAPVVEYRSQDRRARAWEGNGLRVFVPPAEVARSVVRSLPLQGQARRELLPMLARWTPLSGGRRWQSGLEVWLDQQDWGLDSSAAIAISSGRLSLGAGTLRLLARSWLVAGAPMLGSGQGSSVIPAAMVLQLVPQHVEGAASADMLAGPTLRNAPQEGQLFDRLLVDLVCDPGQVVLIVPAHPREEWTAASAAGSRDVGGVGSPSAPGGELEISPRPIDDAPAVSPVPIADSDGAGTASEPAGTAVGPAIPDLLTLGEAMLTDATVGRSSHRRVIIAITPRIPREFSPVRSPSASAEPPGVWSRSADAARMRESANPR